MSMAGVQRGFLRKYGGFMFKQWKEKYLILTTEGSLMVCRDAESPADQVVALQGGCEAIVEGREILDLPRLPPGGRRDCCLALILPQDKFLLLMADSPGDCSQWLNMLRKVKESVSSPLTNPPCKRHQSLTPCITDRDPLPDAIKEKGPGSRRLSEQAPPSSPGIGDISEGRMRGNRSPRQPKSPGIPSRQRSVGCLRHGNSSDARAVRAVYLLMGGAAASSALGYLGSCSSPSPHDARPPEHLSTAADFPDMGGGSAYHACSQAVDSPHFHSFDFEADSDFDAFDCGGFAF
ncbi:hypothetical protein COCON_G00074320 [Conger conger]|uniref:PH domain-containing protein n=1 Tax=Conger conger TaxID=82655 RepID=A0A9Q1DNB4_CONCO|nr:uncharacterized protein si:ch1073-83n3.2 [Conger conger]KAJ8275680.1 hypothetical protein COCON_G00074320 [Conger conger]